MSTGEACSLALINQNLTGIESLETEPLALGQDTLLSLHCLQRDYEHGLDHSILKVKVCFGCQSHSEREHDVNVSLRWLQLATLDSNKEAYTAKQGWAKLIE